MLDQFNKKADMLHHILSCSAVYYCQVQLEIISDSNCTNAKLRSSYLFNDCKLNFLCDRPNKNSLQLDIVSHYVFTFSNFVKKIPDFLKSTKCLDSPNIKPMHTTMMFGTWHGSGGIHQL